MHQAGTSPPHLIVLPCPPVCCVVLCQKDKCQKVACNQQQGCKRHPRLYLFWKQPAEYLSHDTPTTRPGQTTGISHSLFRRKWMTCSTNWAGGRQVRWTVLRPTHFPSSKHQVGVFENGVVVFSQMLCFYSNFLLQVLIFIHLRAQSWKWR